MRLYRWISDFHGSDRPIALAIGNFDGFHVGHQAVIARVEEKARAMNLQSAVMIFEPQPMEFFGRSVPARLFSLRDKLRIFKSSNLDNVFCMSFTRSFSQLSDMEFVRMLKDKLNVRSVTVGSNFSFGRGGQYSIEDLKRCCTELGLECSAIDKVENEGIRVSSTLIRSLLQNGDFSTARKLIGRHYSIYGRVVHGNAIGRTLGFPTANINLNRRVCPLNGVFAVRVRVSGDIMVYDGMANVGYRPTLSEPHATRSLLEVNIFDFDKDIYGKELEVCFLHKIRDERKFQSLDDLVQQISADKEKARFLLNLKKSA